MDLVCVLKKCRAAFQLYLHPSYSINRFSHSEKYIIAVTSEQPVAHLTKQIWILLTRYGFSQNRPFITLVQKAFQLKRSPSPSSQNFKCNICTQYFINLKHHQRHQLSKFGCRNIARLKFKEEFCFRNGSQGAPRSLYKAHYALGLITWLGSTPTLSTLTSRNSGVAFVLSSI